MHSTIAYVSLLPLALFVAMHGASTDEESEELGASTDVDYEELDANCTCPAPALTSTRNNKHYPLGCIYNCSSYNCTIPDGTPCYVLTLGEVKEHLQIGSTVPNCTCGLCRNGTCVSNGTVEECFAVEEIEET
uniref:Evasin P985 n=1 Tax=Amblyomma parvum TaxID=251391 RepID=EV985_AMBPA|nr:RecName: Full=Evasin P985; Flags: Precursor [Amblyomma parvum]